MNSLNCALAAVIILLLLSKVRITDAFYSAPKCPSTGTKPNNPAHPAGSGYYYVDANGRKIGCVK